MLTFMAGMIGFCLTGDLFDLFVFFELMSVSAVALVAYKVDEQASLEGGLNFAVINTIGSFLFLLGIGLIYAQTGALNLAQIGTRSGPCAQRPSRRRGLHPDDGGLPDQGRGGPISFLARATPMRWLWRPCASCWPAP